MKRIFVVMLALVMIFTICSTASAEKYRVTTKVTGLYVRDRVTKAEMGSLAKDSTIDVEKIVNGYAYITWHGKPAMCWSKDGYLTPLKSSSTSTKPGKPGGGNVKAGDPAKVQTPSGKGLNVRDGASLEGTKVIFTLSQGYNITVISVNGKWAEIDYGKGTGWVWKKYLKKK